MKGSQVFGIIMAIVLIVFAVVFPVPDKRIRVTDYSWGTNIPWHDKYGEEYVGGDAYNFQMEASLKAGYMSGILAMKAITFVGGVLLLFQTLYSHHKCNVIQEQARWGQVLSKLPEHSKEQIELLKGMSEALTAYIARCEAKEKNQDKANEPEKVSESEE